MLYTPHMQDARFKLIRIFSGLSLVGACMVLCACSTGELKPGAKSILDVFQEPTVTDAAVWSIDPYDPDKRYRGTLLLANAPFGNEPVYIRMFADNARDEDPGVRSAATRGLANHGTSEHIPIILERLKDTDTLVRIEAARALQRLHSPAAVGPLLDSLDANKEPEVEVRAEVADALGQYAENRVVDRLIQTFEDENLSVNRTTLKSLKTLTGQDFGFDRALWSDWNKSSKSTFAARGVYMYPVFSRGKTWYEYVPFVPPPPNESSSTPAGLTPTSQ